MAQRGDFGLQRVYLGLQLEDAAYAGKGQPFVDQTHDRGDPVYVVAAVTPLVSLGSLRRDQLELLESAEKRLLDVEHRGDLAHREEGQAVVAIRSDRRQLTQLSMDVCVVALTWMRRGLAFSASGSFTVSTPST